MLQNDDGGPETRLLNLEAWRDSLRGLCGRYHPEGVQPSAFLGWAQVVNISGLAAVDMGWNAVRAVRTARDVRLDSVEHFYALFQISGKAAVTQNDRAVLLDAGDVVLVDAARPVTYHDTDSSARCLSLHLPRRSLIAHLGFQPQGGSCGRGVTAAGRLLHSVVRDGRREKAAPSAPADRYMQMAIYDLVGALFAPSDPVPASRSSEQLFARVCNVIREGFSDPDFGPCAAAAEAGISLRYVQKLFTARGSTYSEYIYGLRLDHAAHLLCRRALLGTEQPLTEIAYACGFRDYAHFARKFRQRFGYPPGAHAARDQERHGPGSTRWEW